jgi:Flp pilus assembly protein TadB
MSEEATAHRKERRAHALEAARSKREGERMQWEVKKLQDSQAKTEASLKRKAEEHSAALKKVRALQVSVDCCTLQLLMILCLLSIAVCLFIVCIL